jgi:hypothetical protein
MKTSSGYVPPPIPWALDSDERKRIRRLHPNVAEIVDLQLPRGRGFLFGYLLPALTRIRAVRSLFLSVNLARFRPAQRPTATRRPRPGSGLISQTGLDTRKDRQVP